MSGAAEMEQLGRRLWGEPTHKTPNEIRFGSHGSKCIKPKEGKWYDHEADKGGGYADLYEKVHGERPADASIAATYDYLDAAGKLLFQVVRKIPKKFVQRHPDTNGGWVWNMQGVERVPYRLPELLNDPFATVFICEGEKDCDALHARGLIATTNPGGAGKWTAPLSRHLADRDVVILPDNDEAGENHAADVARKLAGAARSVRVLRLPDLPPKGDVSDWLAAGGTAEALGGLAKVLEADASEAAPPVKAGSDQTIRIREYLDVHAWADLDIPPTIRLLGELIVPGSRTFLVGTTGVGKTLIAYEMGAAMAAGKGWLHWTSDRACRVLLIDGEMPDALIKQRVTEIIRRNSIRPGNLTIYAVGRSEKIQKDLGLAQMPPLNTEAGHKWIIALIELLKPDVVVFDNLMSLAPGNHAEPDTWLGVLPLVPAITKAGPAQIWCDHSGWDASRQYGTSTKAWTFDTVGIIKPPREDQREPHALTVSLTFDQPGKARRRTPGNWQDFKTIDMTLRDGAWTAVDTGTTKSVSPKAAGWLKDIAAIFDVPGVAEDRTVTVLGQNCVRFSISRAQLREWLRKCGRIGDDSHANLTDKDRTKLRDWLNALREAGKIGIDGEYLWLA